MIKVCDAIMGAGKSSAAIAYLNEHSNNKFIYITPYLEEANRIKKGCPKLNFIEPSNKLAQYNFKKSEHTMALIKEGRNITTTHQAFKRYTQSTLNDIREQEYTLIIDENINVLEEFDFHQDDLRIAIDMGYITDNDGTYSLANDNYEGKALRQLFNLFKSRELIKTIDRKNNSLFYWALPPDLFTSFKDVFILTYLFEGQSLHHFMKIYDIPYEHIGVERTNDGGYKFGNYPGYTPEYVYNLKNMIHIIDKEKLNAVGDSAHSLSMGWFQRGSSGVEQLKRNVYNCFNNIWRDIPADKKLWGTYSGGYNKIKGRGYTKAFLAFNTKATNAYINRDHLVYATNLFMNVRDKNFYLAHGIKVDENAYALSIMVQWIWRSAIRVGSEIYLYIPSKRMRTLLINWLDDISKGGNTINNEKM